MPAPAAFGVGPGEPRMDAAQAEAVEDLLTGCVSRLSSPELGILGRTGTVRLLDELVAAFPETAARVLSQRE